MRIYLQAIVRILKHFVCDTGELLRDAHRNGKNILFEAQLGALRDIYLGIYPFTSSSSPLAAFAPIGAGVPDIRLDRVIGIVKAYSTCVGEGPFVAEQFGPEADRLREEHKPAPTEPARSPLTYRLQCTSKRRRPSRPHSSTHSLMDAFRCQIKPRGRTQMFPFVPWGNCDDSRRWQPISHIST